MTSGPPPPKLSSLPPRTRFGRYEVLSEIASGGMATVYVGRVYGAAGFQRLVAIKTLHPHIARDEQFVQMFMDEARLAARIRHPNVVPTIDLENGPDGLFLVMEYVEGDALLGILKHTIVKGEPIPAPVAIRIVLDLLEGLHAAHELCGDRGEALRPVHRDVSPHNVLVGLDGTTRVTDFGIAHAEERLSVTREGTVKGKLAYMAPEQTAPGALDRRADLFAAGVVLWECLANRRLFAAASDGEVLRNLLSNPVPSLREHAPHLPSALGDVCARALERDRDNRFPTAHAFAEALELAASEIGIAGPRAVAAFVKSIAGERIAARQLELRAVSGDLHAQALIDAREPPSDDGAIEEIDPDDSFHEVSESGASDGEATVMQLEKIDWPVLPTDTRAPAIGPPPVSMAPRAVALALTADGSTPVSTPMVATVPASSSATTATATTTRKLAASTAARPVKPALFAGGIAALVLAIVGVTALRSRGGSAAVSIPPAISQGIPTSVEAPAPVEPAPAAPPVAAAPIEPVPVAAPPVVAAVEPPAVVAPAPSTAIVAPVAPANAVVAIVPLPSSVAHTRTARP